MGLGIAADVFAVTLITAILFPKAFKKYWLVWLLAVGGGHALLPMVGQLSVIYLGPVLQDWFGLSTLVVEIVKTVAVGLGCYLLWLFLKEVYEGISKSEVEVFTGLSVAIWWGCTADAAYSGAAKAAPALDYGWNLPEIIASNVIAGLTVMVICVIAIIGGVFLKSRLNKPGYQVGAFFIEFAILGYFLVFFALSHLRKLLSYSDVDLTGLPLELISASIAVAFVAHLFRKDWDAIMAAQTKNLEYDEPEPESDLVVN
jgi:hypothetical protein